MKQGIRFIAHLFYEDKRILWGVFVGMFGEEVAHGFLPSWANDVTYLAVMLLTLALSVFRHV